MRELSLLAVLLGIILSVVFGVANAYIGLKVAMTVSASVPAAVISMAILRGILKRGTILENNMVQTIGSSGEGLAAGMIFTLPALYILGAKDPTLMPQFAEMTLWGVLGGLLGVFCMIPLRRVLIVKEHGKLTYPEGVACAEVLQAGERGGASAGPVFWGIGLGGAFEFLRGLGVFPEIAKQSIPVAKTTFSVAAEPALLGVGYILGPRIAAYMLSGALLGSFVLIPAIVHFGSGSDQAVFPGSVPINQMSPSDIHGKYIRYIGAGAVVLGGLFSLAKSLRTVIGSVYQMLASVFSRDRSVERTDRDIPFPFLFLGVLGLAAAVWYSTQMRIADPAAVWAIVACTLVFGFFFVTVSSRLVGMVGSSSNPASGMAIATILGTSLVLVYAMGLSGAEAKGTSIAVGAIVCLAVCLAGDCSQDLKTGFLVKATPWKQQVGEVIGVLVPVAAIAGIIMLINETYGFVLTDEHPNPVAAPQANIMALVVEGVVDGNLPWVLILSGMAIGLIVELLGLPALPFAVGLYLPFYLSTPIMLGAIVRWVVDLRRKPIAEAEDAGVLGASGLVAGQGLAGIALVFSAWFIGWNWNDPKYTNSWTGDTHPVLPSDAMGWASSNWFSFIPVHYGLHSTEVGAFTGTYAIDWYHLLPLAPMLMLMLWLGWVARRTLFATPYAIHGVNVGRPTLEPPAPAGPTTAFHSGDSIPFESPPRRDESDFKT